MASEINKSKRKILREMAIATGMTEVGSQVTRYSKTFENGSLHPVRGKITILPVTRDRADRQHGLSEAAPSRSGNHPDQVPFYGFMGNVSGLIPTLSQELTMIRSMIAGAGKSVLWYVDRPIFRS